MGVVNHARYDSTGFVRERRIAGSTIHLVTATHLGDRHTAGGTRPRILYDRGDRGDEIRIARVALGLRFTTGSTELLLTRSALVCRAQESAAVGWTGRDELALLFFGSRAKSYILAEDHTMIPVLVNSLQDRRLADSEVGKFLRIVGVLVLEGTVLFLYRVPFLPQFIHLRIRHLQFLRVCSPLEFLLYGSLRGR